MDFNPIDLILHLDTYLAMLVSNYGVWIYAILFLVIFCETGLVVTPFLPGDSLLFIAGAICATGGMDPWLLGGLLMVAAITGDSTNYVIGRTLGKRLFSNPDSKVFRRDYLDRTHEFYERHVKLVVSAEVPLYEIYQGERLKFEFQRCLSRLQEMQSEEYLKREHMP